MKRSRKITLAVSLLVALLAAVGVGFALTQAPQGTAQGPQIRYPDFPPTPTIGANPTAAAQLSSGQVLMSSDFADAGALSQWRFVDQARVLESMVGRWVVKDGRLVQDYAGEARSMSTHETAALAGDAGWTDYTVQVSFYDELNGTAGLIARYTGQEPTQARYYRARVLKSTFDVTPKLVLEKVVDGVATALATQDGPGFSERTWHTLVLRVRGGSLWVQLDGKVVAEAQDASPLPAGQAGVYTRALGGISFDDFVVTAP